jgi:hypothetical protein
MEVSGQLHAPAALAVREEPPPPIPIAYEAEWAPEPVRTLWREKKFLTAVGNRTPVVQAVAIRYTD